MSVSRKILQTIALACIVYLGLAENIIESEITGYGTLFVYIVEPRFILTRTLGFASSSNTLYTGAQGSEHSASFKDPGDCATNIGVYPIGTLIYVVVSAGPNIQSSALQDPFSTTDLFLVAVSSSFASYSHRSRDSRNTSRSKIPAAIALRNPSRISTSGWGRPATTTWPNSRPALTESRSKIQRLQSLSILTVVTSSIQRR